MRFADLDANRHVNNAVYSTYFETGRVTLMKDRSYGLMPDGFTWMLVRLDIHFRAELHWPGTIEIGLGVVELRRTSVTFDRRCSPRHRASPPRNPCRCCSTSHAQADVADAGDPGNFQPWIFGAQHRSATTRAAMLAVAIVAHRDAALPRPTN